ncbi:hypothetical protein [Ruegeria arenilitoris]|uniref:hypothetical protein n=1 Tax=Ruegeria arenilitoris TaxID=1173585 RepID=UPI003C79D48A
MSNPFRQTDQQNPYDLPGGPAFNKGAPQQSDHAVLYDAAAKAASPAGVALIEAMMAQLRAEQAKQQDATARVIAKTIRPLLARIDVLEKALDVKRSDTAKAVQSEIDGFLGQTDDDSPLDEARLDAMAQAHSRSMRERGIG